MENGFSIQEILIAFEDLENIKKDSIKKGLKKSPEKLDNSNIPKNTLKLIEEAEKSKN